jgi:hypothetical protein
MGARKKFRTKKKDKEVPLSIQLPLLVFSCWSPLCSLQSISALLLVLQQYREDQQMFPEVRLFSFLKERARKKSIGEYIPLTFVVRQQVPQILDYLLE